MNENEELLEFDLDDILNEFHEDPEEEAAEEIAAEELSGETTAEDIPQADEEPADDTAEAEEVPSEPEQSGEAQMEEPTQRLEKLSDVAIPQPQPEPDPEPEPEPEPVVIEIDPKARLRELKKALIAGPEKRYYDLEELGLGKIQSAIFVSILIVLLCAGITAMSALNMIPDNRMRLVVFSQVLAMLISAWMGCQILLDGLGDLLKFRFTISSMLVITFISCCVDAVFCLEEQRLPCCAAFSLEMTLALFARYHGRSTEMAQMDTLRKAVRLHSLVKVPDYFEKKAGILRDYGKVEDFMGNYSKVTVPQRFQNIYSFVSLLLCGGIAVFAYLRHGTSMAVQIFSTSLLVAVPAGYFVALSRPAAVLQKRLHMVGTVLCGWQGVRKLRGKAVVPLKDEDLFPVGATKLNGVKFYGDRSPDQVISYAASLICTAGGGLVSVFRQLLNSRGGRELPVKNLQTYGDGIGGEIAGVSVLVGSARLLQEMGVEIPEGSMVNQAVYVSIDGEFSAVVAISYGKMRSAAGGIVSLCGTRKLTPVLIGGDFMITESMLRSKFGVNTKRIAFPPQEVRAQLAKRRPEPASIAMALTTRDDLVSYAYAINGAKALRTACTLGTIIHVLGGVLGMLIMLALAYLGSVELLTPVNVLLYQMVWLLPGLLVTEWTRTV